MRIAVLATDRNPLTTPYAGGQEALTAALVGGFRARGHRVVLHAAPGTPHDLADEVWHYPPLPPLSMTALLDPQVPEPQFLADHHAFTASCAELARRSDIDVVANHTLHHLPLSLSRALPAPVVTTLHTPPFPWMELGAALAAPTARYVAVSAALASLWTTLSPRVITNGVDPTGRPLGPGSPAGALAWVGRLTPEKAPHRAAEVARRLGLPLTIVGPVGDAAYVEERLAPLLGGGVTLAGHCDRDRMARIIGASAVVLVTPDWEEPFGMVCVEAAMCGTPVVALGRGGIPEAVPEGCGIVVPDDAQVPEAERLDGLTAAVGRARALPRRVVRERALASGGLDRCVERHLEVLADACSRRDTGG